MKNICPIFLALLWWIAGLSFPVRSATIPAASPSASDVQAAINIALDGDTVQIPAGSATWTVQVVLNNKAVTVQGAGTNLTHITHGLTNALACFKIVSLGTKFARLTGLWFTATSSTTTSQGIIAITGTCSAWRCDHLLFTGPFHRGIMAQGKVEGGCIDTIVFDPPNDSVPRQGVTVWGAGQFKLVPGNTLASFPAGTPWTAAAIYGTSARVFVEDCLFNFKQPGDAALEGYYGGRYVVRFSQIYNTLIGNHGLDSGVNSTHSWEIYGNQFYSTSQASYNGPWFEARGGTGPIVSNRVSIAWLPNASAAGYRLKLESYRATGKAIFTSYNGGFITGTNAYDGNNGSTTSSSGITPSGWPSLEQIGTTGPITLGPTNSSMTLDPVYIWANSYGSSLGNQTGSVAVTIGPNYVNPRASGSDLVIDGVDNTKVTSATRVFAATDVDSWLQITGGTGFTVGWYKIVSIVGNAAILYSSPGTLGSTGGVWFERFTAIPPTDIIISGRDYFLNAGAKPGWTPYTYPNPLRGPMPILWTLSVTSSNPISGVPIQATTDINGNGNGTTTFNRTYNGGDLITLTTPASLNAGTYLFSKWQKNGIDNSTSLSVTFNMLASQTYTAVYTNSIPPPVATSLAFGQQPTTAVENTNISPGVTVRIFDQNGNLFNSPATVTVAIGTNPGGGTLNGTLALAAVNGIATFNDLSITTAGIGYTLTASSPGLAGATSSTFNITAAVLPATQLIIAQQPTSTFTGLIVAPAITVKICDANGAQTDSTDNVTVSIGTNPGGATLSGTLTKAAVNGLATFSNLSLDMPGVGYTLHFVSGVLTPTDSSAFTITTPTPVPKSPRGLSAILLQ